MKSCSNFPSARRPIRGWNKVLIVGFSITALALTACAAPEKGSGTEGATSSTTSDGPIKIGVNIELSGPAAVQGTAYKNAVQLVASQVNEEGLLGGRKIELVIRDNKSDPTEALQVAKGMVENDGVVAIVGGGSSPTTLSTIDYVKRVGIPIVSMGSSDAIVNPAKERTFVFKTPAGAGMVVDVMLDRFKKSGTKSIGLISVDNPYGEAGVQAFDDKAKAAGVKVVGSEKFQATDKDYTSIVTKLTSSQPDAIVVWAIPPGAGIVAKNITASGFSGPVYYDPGAGAELFIRGAGEAANGSLLVHPAVLVSDQIEDAENLKEMRAFHKEYTAKYGEFSGFASYAADGLGMIVQAIKDGGSADRTAIRDALDKIHYVGVTGVYDMTPEDHGRLNPEALKVVTVTNGKWELVNGE